MNQALISYLTKEGKKAVVENRESITTVIESIRLCPIELNLEDSLDLIGVDDFVTKKLNQYFKGTNKYIPKEGSLSRQVFHAIYNSHPNTLTKSDINREIGVKPPPDNIFRKNKTFFGNSNITKQLEIHEYVERIPAKPPRFLLTEKGLDVAQQLFGPKELSQPSQSISCLTILVSKADINNRVSIDVADVIRRTHLKSIEVDLPIGSLWFQVNDSILNYIIQFVSSTNAADDGFQRKMSSSPFEHKIFLIPSRETVNHVQLKLRNSSSFGIDTVFAETPALIAQYIVGISKLINSEQNVLGTLENVIEKCRDNKFETTVGKIWKSQLRCFPGCGPNAAANLSAVFPTPHSLQALIENTSQPSVKIGEALFNRWGRRPAESTIKAMIHLFTPYCDID